MIRDLYSDAHERAFKTDMPQRKPGFTETGPLADIDLSSPKTQKPSSSAEQSKKAGLPSNVIPAGDSGPPADPSPKQPAEQPATFADASAKQLAKQLKIDTETAAKMLQQPGFAEQVNKTEKPGKQPGKQPEQFDTQVDTQVTGKQKKQAAPESPATPPSLPEKRVPPTPPPIDPSLRPPEVPSTVQEALATAPELFLENYGMGSRGNNAELEHHLDSSGVFDGATADQLTRFAQMLEIPQAEFVTTPNQLRGAIMLNNAQPKLRAILENVGILERPQQATGMERLKQLGGEFAQGYMDKSGLGAASKFLRRQAGRVLGTDRQQAYAAATAEPETKKWASMTPLERAMYKDEDDYNAQQTYGKKEVERLQAGKHENPGIVMPTGEIDNEDAEEGDQLGLFESTGKKKTQGKKYKPENKSEPAKQKVMFERMNDHPDQKSLFGTFQESVERYQAELKKK